MGLGLGYLLHRLRDQPRLPLRPVASALAWVAALLVLVLVVFGLAPYQKDRLLTAPLLLRSVYGGLHRLAWALALAWVILACAKGVGGPVNTVLSWHLWTPLNRMSYTIYLVHMTIMQVTHSYASYRVDMSQVSSRVHPHSSQATILYDLMFAIILSISVSYLLIMLFEVVLTLQCTVIISHRDMLDIFQYFLSPGTLGTPVEASPILLWSWLTASCTAK